MPRPLDKFLITKTDTSQTTVQAYDWEEEGDFLVFRGEGDRQVLAIRKKNVDEVERLGEE